MAENFPGYGAEPGRHESGKSKDKESSSKKEKGEGLFSAGGEPARRPGIFEKVGGDTPVPKLEKNIFQFGEAKKPEVHELEKHERAESDQQAELLAGSRAGPERQSRLQRPTVEELASLAAQVEQANLEAMHQAARTAETEKSDDGNTEEKPGKEKDKKDSAEESVKMPAITPEQAPAPPEPEPSDALMQRNMPAEFAEATSGEQLGDVSPGASVAERLSQADKEFADLAGERAEPGELTAANFAESPASPSAEQTQPESFDTSQPHPDLVELAGRPEMAAASNSDKEFNDIVQNSLGRKRPGRTLFREQAPGKPPVEVGNGGAASGPPFRPAAEGAEYGGGSPRNPNGNPWAPAGDMLNPAVVAGLSAVEARQELNSLKHSARERGLAGAIGILGLGLVLEHFRVSRLKRRERKVERQFKKQNKALNKTNQALQQEQVAHQNTRSRLDRLASEDAATNEQFHRLQTPELSPAETVAGAGLISAAAAAELATKTGHRVEAFPIVASREYDKQTGAEPTSEMAIADRNTKLPQTAELAGIAVGSNHEFREAAQPAEGATRVGELLRPETRHERIQDKLSSDRKGGSAAADSSIFAPNVPGPTSSVNAPAGKNASLPPPHSHRNAVPLTNFWAWIVVGFILIALLVGAFVR